VTCARTGLFVELTVNGDKTPLLNFGKKAVVSLRDQLNNEVTRNF
jgi:hypothetical protein